MTEHDENLINSALDGELDESFRREVEVALQTRPEFADEWNRRIVLRKLLKGLPEPTTIPDVSIPVQSWISRQIAQRRAASTVFGAASLAVAATVLITLALTQPRGDQFRVVRQEAPAVDQDSGTQDSESESTTEPDSLPSDPDRVDSESVEVVVDQQSNPPDSSERNDAERAVVGPFLSIATAERFLDDLRDFGKADRVDIQLPIANSESALDTINTILQETVRDDPRYGLIRGFHDSRTAIEPELVDQYTTVYALVANGNERNHLERSLRNSLGLGIRDLTWSSESQLIEILRDTEIPMVLLSDRAGDLSDLGSNLLNATREEIEHPLEARPPNPNLADGVGHRSPRDRADEEASAVLLVIEFRPAQGHDR